MGRHRRIALAVLAAGGLLLPGCGDERRRLHGGWEKGMNVTAYQADALASATGDRALRALRATGTTHGSIVTLWFMDTETSNEIRPDPIKTATDASVLHAMRTARQLGMKVTLKPHFDVRNGVFRGAIRPTAVDEWFTSYRAMVEHYARLAAEGGAERFVVGTELTSMSGYNDRWRAVIAAARARFPGRLTFSANLVEGAEQVRFWDALDEIGIDAYMPLAPSTLRPSVSELVRAWQPYREQIARLRHRYEKPVLFTELGYQARTGTTRGPARVEGPPDDAAQQRAYEAAYRAWSEVPWFKGIYWWDWAADGRSGAATEDFSPANRPAEATIRKWNRRSPAGVGRPA